MFNLLILFSVILLFLLLLSALYGKSFFWVSSKNTPILFQYFIKRGLFLGLKRIRAKDYEIYTYRSFNFGKNNLNAMILFVNLNFKTKLHIVAISKNQHTKNLRIEGVNNLIEKVELEGDYSNFFTLYTEKGSQAQARYIIDPDAMSFTIDFCKFHSWEINDSNFYFVWENFEDTKQEKAKMFEHVEKFIEEIKPALITPLTDQEIQIRKSYGSATLHKEDIKCPVCNNVLIETFEDVYECPKRHGTLLHSSDLLKLRHKKLSLKYNSSEVVDNLASNINCPSCKNPMHKVNYAMSKTIIDACSICYFRWIDSGELVQTTLRS